MNCENVEKLLSEYIDRCLEDVDQAAVAVHLETCTACRAEAQAFSALLDDVSGLSGVVPPAGFAQRVMGRIQKEKARPGFFARFFMSIKTPVPVTALLLVFGLAVYLYQYKPFSQQAMRQMTDAGRVFPETKHSPQDVKQEAQIQSLEKKKEHSVGETIVFEQKNVLSGKSSENVSRSRDELFTEKRSLLPKSQVDSQTSGFGEQALRSLSSGNGMDDEANPISSRAESLPSIEKNVSPSHLALTFLPKTGLEEKEILQGIARLVQEMSGSFVSTDEHPGVPEEMKSASVLWIQLPESRLNEFKISLRKQGEIAPPASAPTLLASRKKAISQKRKSLPPFIKIMIQFLPEIKN